MCSSSVSSHQNSLQHPEGSLMSNTSAVLSYLYNSGLERALEKPRRISVSKTEIVGDILVMM